MAAIVASVILARHFNLGRDIGACLLDDLDDSGNIHSVLRLVVLSELVSDSAKAEASGDDVADDSWMPSCFQVYIPRPFGARNSLRLCGACRQPFRGCEAQHELQELVL